MSVDTRQKLLRRQGCACHVNFDELESFIDVTVHVRRNQYQVLRSTRASSLYIFYALSYFMEWIWNGPAL